MSEQEKRGLSDNELENIAGGKLSKKDEKRIREIIREELEKQDKPKKPTVRPISAYMAPISPLTEEMKKKALEAIKKRNSDDNKK